MLEPLALAVARLPDAYASLGVLLAAGQNFDKFKQMGAELRRRTTDGAGDDFALLAIIATVVPLLVLALMILVKFQEKHENLNSPKGLFRELARAHGLDRAERHLLLELAARHQLTDPARVFLEPERFDPALLTAHNPTRAAQLDALRTRLFQRDLPTPASPGAARHPSAPAPHEPAPHEPAAPARDQRESRQRRLGERWA